MDGIQPVMNVGSGYNNGYGCGGFMGEGIWLFAILALFGLGGNGLFGGGQAGRAATVEDLNNSANFTRLESQVQGIGQAIAQQNTNLSNAVCQLGYQSAVDFGNLSKQIAECCCRMERELLENRYLAAQNTAAINTNTTAQVQKVLDVLCQDKIEAQQARINQLELNQALCGVVRYPTQATFNAGYPLAFGGYGYNGGCGNGFAY